MASFSAPLPSTPHAYKRNFSGKPLIFSTHPKRIFFFGNAASCSRTKIIASSSSPNDASDAPGDSTASTFCIIEGPETVQDFVQMQLQEIQDNIKSRRNKIFLLMEEVSELPNYFLLHFSPEARTIIFVCFLPSLKLRRLRVQQRIKSMKWEPDRENEMPDIPSSIPFLPHVVTLPLVSNTVILSLEIDPKDTEAVVFDKLFVHIWNYSIWRSHCTNCGAVGVISALMLLEINNVEQQEKKRCKYCHGTGVKIALGLESLDLGIP
ncbi:hypothetical protein SASPL_136061 [Salvia splendens]|uniref:Uncharacterized protein n=1 Tax=Salvia splendens TaxID=180675 RepID=A0A8X8ZGJ1_SALSN|nr:hypothetical protein SASPL_136061 [Salvia splendens]